MMRLVRAFARMHADEIHRRRLQSGVVTHPPALSAFSLARLLTCVSSLCGSRIALARRLRGARAVGAAVGAHGRLLPLLYRRPLHLWA
eukprot:978635-Pleurochrysis_carterae.AAC.1